MGTLDDAGKARVDAALSVWRQGDCVVGDEWFVFRLQPDAPLTEVAAAAAAEGSENAEMPVHGFAVLTQTCDIVRSCTQREWVEVCPLVAMDDEERRQVERGRRPRYAFISGVDSRGLVADLDRVMTVEKPVVATWERTVGCITDEEQRRFALALSRKRNRVAFPDDFVAFVAKLRSRLAEKHDKQTDEGRALRALREIRVRAAPSWHAEQVSLHFWFIRADMHETFDGTPWHSLLELWRKRVPASGRFTHVDCTVETLSDLTALDYVESDPLDLDYLSDSAGSTSEG